MLDSATSSRSSCASRIDETRTDRRSFDGDGDSDGSEDASYALFVSSPAGTRTIALRDKSSFIVGRAPWCDVVMSDESLSREHARLTVGGGVTLTDLGSKNGTRVRGREIERRERCRIAVGAAFELGSVTFVLRRTDAPRDASFATSGQHLAIRGPDHSADGGPVVLDPAMRAAYATLDVVAPSPLSVLVLGETGVGKEIYAREVHRRSKRAAGPFIPIHCAALPETLLESELFGYEKGAFTGATRAKPGLFEAADRGTVFLDEVGEIPLSTQAKLLRVLEGGEVTRLGSLEPRKVDVRFVAATHRDLRALITDQQFRADLYFRLNGISVTLPPLRHRRSDIAAIAETLARNAAREMKREGVSIDAGAMALLESHPWPGNVREMKNVLERAVILSDGGVIDRAALERAEPEAFGSSRPSEAPSRGGACEGAVASGLGGETARELKARARDLDRQELVDALRKTAGNQSRAADLLGISRFTLMNRMQTYGLARPRKPR